jgi:hypothetical protein
MLTDAEIIAKGLQILTQQLGVTETERFLALMRKSPFDYTTWRQQQTEAGTLAEISARAQSLRRKH